MGTILTIGDVELDIDVDRTRAAYLQAEAEGGQRCICNACRNLHPQMPAILDLPVRDFLAAAGMDESKPAEFVHYGLTVSGHLYEIVYGVFGRCISGPMIPAKWPGGSVEPFRRPIKPGVSVIVREGYFPVQKPLQGVHALNLSFCFDRVPWVLPEPDPG
jgi:hypothetical protein